MVRLTMKKTTTGMTHGLASIRPDGTAELIAQFTTEGLAQLVKAEIYSEPRHDNIKVVRLTSR